MKGVPGKGMVEAKPRDVENSWEIRKKIIGYLDT